MQKKAQEELKEGDWVIYKYLHETFVRPIVDIKGYIIFLDSIGGNTTQMTIDRYDDEYYKITLKERMFSNRRIEHFVNKLQATSEYPNQLIGKKHSKNKLYPIKERAGNTAKKNIYGTFDSEIALENENIEFLAFGHPIVNKLINYCIDDNFHGETGVQIVNYHVPFKGMVFNYIVTFNFQSGQFIIRVFKSRRKRVPNDFFV